MSTSDAGMFLPLGGAREIGANSYLLRLDGHDILLDCGVHPKKEGLGAVPDFSLLDRSPDAAIVSHGHVDHCGALPCLVSRFPHVAAFATAATVSVIDRMLHNSVKVMESMAVERGIRDYPLYSHDEVDCAIQRMCGEAYERPFVLKERGDVTVSLHRAGHVLGGASVLIRSRNHTVFYTGDICAADQELVEGRADIDPSIAID
ncbi:MAG TPA: MBL fold metallo-hydrolase, partial [Candidatus Hydrogenedentes bacterium]|nr:MBL fold metallo-hydrolase [Candidatus Hydrogenedentota bacterium]